jgi:hypothetical protein
MIANLKPSLSPVLISEGSLMSRYDGRERVRIGAATAVLVVAILSVLPFFGMVAAVRWFLLRRRPNTRQRDEMGGI